MIPDQSDVRSVVCACPHTRGDDPKKNEQIGFIGYKDVNKIRGLYLHNKASVSVEKIINSERGLCVIMHIKIYK